MRSLTRSPWIVFTALRLLFFVVPLVAAVALGANLALAAVLAAVIALALSVIFLPKLRSSMAASIAARAKKGGAPAPRSDEEIEDVAVDGRVAVAAEDAEPDASQTAKTSAKPTP